MATNLTVCVFAQVSAAVFSFFHFYMSVVALMTLVKSGADFFLKRACGSPSGFIAFFTGFTDSLRVDLIVHAVFFCVFPFLWFSLPLSPDGMA